MINVLLFLICWIIGFCFTIVYCNLLGPIINKKIGTYHSTKTDQKDFPLVFLAWPIGLTMLLIDAIISWFEYSRRKHIMKTIKEWGK